MKSHSLGRKETSTLAVAISGDSREMVGSAAVPPVLGTWLFDFARSSIHTRAMRPVVLTWC